MIARVFPRRTAMSPTDALAFFGPPTIENIADCIKAAGWKCVGQAGGLRWTGKRKPEVDLCPAQMKIRFEREEGGKHE